ncbi:hypothetical protein G7K_6802-t1 [Saitoella complicata NRRL Y-17804]|uniref:2-(3-amino-3-carboxypropyl)histidine synthase subunit 2 n=1 Tax=Saitoella complicata (strain BCRC 22490 / CBS 7301 / JCM 7358 / NBRC 10748 / NRRL Y-17804) TaxID=698492 RepID=A0A0E9NS62_SAICN|nr:hypothetical protein G7K_6802-t1 [Saitoella complicata NRRL Y-17804]
MAAELTTAPPLSDDATAVLERTVEVEQLPASATGYAFHEVYEIERTVRLIQEGGYRNIALQFSDELLSDAAGVVDALRKPLTDGQKVYVLADTSYGSCCVDEVAAEHISADAIVHYGRACLSPTSRLPVIYVFGRRPVDLDAAVKGFEEVLESKDADVIAMSDVTYSHALPSFCQRLREAGYTNTIETTHATIDTVPPLSSTSSPTSTSTLPGREYSLPEAKPLSDYTIFYLGPPSTTLTTLLMTHNSLTSSIYSHNPLTLRTTLESPTTNARLRRRYAMVQKARDAGTIGIVVGTLGVAGYLTLISDLRKLIFEAGKKPYTFVMGKLNPAKMANFGEVECFVLVACGENSLIESRDFYRPVVTPYELGLALRARGGEAPSWTGEWVTDFDRVMRLNSSNPPGNDDEGKDPWASDDDEPHFSLITGRYESSSRPMATKTLSLDPSHTTDLVQSNGARALVTATTIGGVFSPSAEYLQKGKVWKGLGNDVDVDEEEGEDDGEGAVVQEGRAGIARDYGHDI